MTATLEQLAERVGAVVALPSPAECRRLREQCRATRRDVGDVVGVTQAAVALWESGAARPTPEHAVRYLEVLRVFAASLGEAL